MTTETREIKIRKADINPWEPSPPKEEHVEQRDSPQSPPHSRNKRPLEGEETEPKRVRLQTSTFAESAAQIKQNQPHYPPPPPPQMSPVSYPIQYAPSPPQTPSFSDDSCNLFVKYIPHEWKDEDLKSNFEPFGEVVSAKVMIDVVTKESRAFGFVRYTDLIGANNGIANMNGKLINGRNLIVKFAKETPENTPRLSVDRLQRTGSTPTTNVYIKGIPLEMDKAALDEFFSPYGKIEESLVLIDKTNGASLGQAFVRYEQLSQAEYAITALTGYMFPGATRPILIKFADSNEEKSQRKRFFPRGRPNNIPMQYPAYPPHYYQHNEQYHHPYYPPSSYQYGPPIQYPYQNTMNINGPAVNDFNLYIYQLPSSTTDDTLYTLFSPFGSIQSAKAITDLNTGACKGYGFVRMLSYEAGMKAISAMNGYMLEGRQLSVSWKK